jgi:Ras-related protein Rab-18
MSVSPEGGIGEPLYTVKILLLGESSVGKSSLVNRYTNHVFESKGLLTIGIEVKKIMKHVGGKRIRLERSTTDT